MQWLQIMGLAEAAAPSNEPEPHVDLLRHVNLFSTATGSLRQAMKPIRSRQLFYHVLHAFAHASVHQTPQTRPRSSSDQHTRTTQGRARGLRRHTEQLCPAAVLQSFSAADVVWSPKTVLRPRDTHHPTSGAHHRLRGASTTHPGFYIWFARGKSLSRLNNMLARTDCVYLPIGFAEAGLQACSLPAFSMQELLLVAF